MGRNCTLLPTHACPPRSLLHLYAQGDGKILVGRDHELLIIMSCPGDHWEWEGRSQGDHWDWKGALAKGPEKAPGNIHTTFKEYAKISDDRIKFCPIQASDLGRTLGSVSS